MVTQTSIKRQRIAIGHTLPWITAHSGPRETCAP
jgi:hypothetical protein